MKWLMKFCGLSLLTMAVSCSAETPPGNTSSQPVESAGTTVDPSAAQAKKAEKKENNAAMRVYIDPVTGKPTTPPPGSPILKGQQQGSAPADNTSEQIILPGDGGVMSTYNRPQSFLKAVKQPDGSIKYIHETVKPESAEKNQ